MKLVELLARELKAWPDGAEFYCQDYNRNAYPYEVKPERHEHSDVLWGCKGQLSGVPAAVLSDIASDHATAIVTSSDWAAERARIAKPAKKADKDGWIRHRGGKAPVSDDVFIDVRYRDGEILECQKFEKSEAYLWTHGGACGDIMAYRLHKPAEQVVNMDAFSDCVNALGDSHADVMESVLSRIEGPLQWRDRITEIDATTQALTTERADLVQKLASEGFALIGRVVDSAVCQPDPGRWMIGDSVECVSSSCSFITVGTVYKITGFDRNMVQFLDNDGTEMEYERENFKFHSRPSA